jgi:hypothetical protein
MRLELTRRQAAAHALPPQPDALRPTPPLRRCSCARAHARASFDGKKTQRLRRGSSIFFTSSVSPLPVLSLAPMDSDWCEAE